MALHQDSLVGWFRNVEWSIFNAFSLDVEMEKETKEELTPQQIAYLKPVFIGVCMLAVMFAWFTYYAYTRESGWYTLWLIIYFYMCNGATNIRAVTKWPFYSSGSK